jgi:small subunit ribosomal protein S1
VELEPGLDGLVHVSELASGKKGADARKLIQAGGTLHVKVLEVDAQARRISLGRIDPDAPEEEVEIRVGATVSGKVERVEPFGVFVRLGPGLTGLIRNEEMGTPLGTDHRRDFAPGTAVECEVVAVEEGGKRISLSRGRAQARAERQEIERFKSQPGGGLAAGFATLADAFKKSFNEKEED